MKQSWFIGLGALTLLSTLGASGTGPHTPALKAGAAPATVLTGKFDWPQWRGPHGDGTSTETRWNAIWPAEGPRKVWEARVGRGFSSFAVVGGRLYTLGTGAKGRGRDSETVYCLDAATGKEIWTYPYDMGLPCSNAPVSSTPAVSDGRVYTLGNGANLLCLDAASGELIWGLDLAKEMQAITVTYGYCASPVVYGQTVIAPVFNGKPQPPRGGGPYPKTGGKLVAFDKATGKVVWENKDGASAWATTALGELNGKTTLVTYTGSVLLAIDPATGATLWKDDSFIGALPAIAAMPVLHDNRIYFPVHARGTHGLEVRDGQPHDLWRTNAGHWYENFAIWDSGLYIPGEGGRLACVDIKTGQTRWNSDALARDPAEDGKATSQPVERPAPPQRAERAATTQRAERLPTTQRGPNRGASGGAFMIADGKILLMNPSGWLVCAELKPEGPKILSMAKVLENDMGAWKYHCVPTLVNGRIYCRNTQGQIVCLDVSASK